MSYIVHNLTNRTIVLADLRAEIGPKKMLDLEKVAARSDIDRSYDLRFALDSHRLRCCSTGIVSRNSKPEIQVVEKVIEKHEVEHHHHESSGIDEMRLMAMMKRVMAENKPAAGDNQQVLDAVAALQKQLETMGGESGSESEGPSIAPELLADLQAKAVAKMSEDIETGNKKSGRKVILKNTRLGDLADELD